ncbi:MAG: hypothetical protein IJE05_04710 [Clostridia bacterium]|nr:hypothetical protein [Clostridia bacterium]
MEQNLDVFNENIIKWYEFSNTNKIMQLGKNENITRYLEKIFEEVIVVEKVENININEEKFDYILIYGVEGYYDSIEKVSKFLKEDGKVLLIGRNPFGINNWGKYSIEEKDGVRKLENYYKHNCDISKIKEKIINSNLAKTNIYYAFPDYSQTELVINEKFNIQKSILEKYKPILKDDEIKVFDEIKVLKNIVENNSEMLEFFANSYFIEASKKEIDTDIRFVSYNNCRNEKYRLITLIRDNVVQKIPVNDFAKEHIKQMGETINDIKDCGIDVLDYEENGIIYSKLIKNEKTLDEVLGENYNNLNYVVEILNNIKEILLRNSVKYSENKENIDSKGQDDKLLENLNFMKKAFWDMIPKNCFYINNKFIFFDQEWKKEYLPVEFIIYRSVINSYDLVRKINVDELLEKLNILQYKEYFEKLDEDIRNEIINEKIYKEMYCKEIKAVDNLINENIMYKEYIQKLENEVIKDLQEDNRKKQEYIDLLEEKNRINEEKIKKIFFWKR